MFQHNYLLAPPLDPGSDPFWLGSSSCGGGGCGGGGISCCCCFGGGICWMIGPTSVGTFIVCRPLLRVRMLLAPLPAETTTAELVGRPFCCCCCCCWGGAATEGRGTYWKERPNKLGIVFLPFWGLSDCLNWSDFQIRRIFTSLHLFFPCFSHKNTFNFEPTIHIINKKFLEKKKHSLLEFLLQYLVCS